MQPEIEILNNSDHLPLVSIIIINSRGDLHASWVRDSIRSALSQNIPVEVIVVDNIGRPYTIGKCWNEAVSKATAPFCFFLGDDDSISFDACETFFRWANSESVKNSRTVNITSGMIAFEDSTGKKMPLVRQHTGMFKKEYLLKYPFNEQLQKGVDREYIEELQKRGDLILYIEYTFPYYYRKYSEETSYSCAGKISFVEKPADYFFLTSNRIFLNPITERLSKEVGNENIIVSSHATPELVNNAKVIFVEWANEKAIEIANADVNAKKILRLHAYEAFSDTIKNIDLNKFDTVIFINDYIKDYTERQFGKIKGAVVIPNGVDLNKFTLNENKIRNNKIAYAGYLTRKKGIGELLLIAESLPEYEFHLAGKYQEDDVCDFINQQKPDNVFVHPWQYNINEWLQDKTFVLNTSIRESQGMSIMESMSCGLKPIVRNWIGADKIYPDVWRSISDIKRMLEEPTEPKRYRQFIEDRYNFENIYPQLENLILEGVKC